VQFRRLHPDLSDGEAVDGRNCHPYRDLNLTNLSRRLDSLFNHRWLTGLGNHRKIQAQPALNPACDFLECPNEYMVTSHLPMVGQDQVIVMVNGDVLTISAELSSDIEENNKEKNFYRLTSQHSSFLLNFTLPEDVVSEAASMEFKGDLLIIHLPKRENSRSLMIDVEAH
jgi:HSP20 family molecular chaperone IbpA